MTAIIGWDIGGAHVKAVQLDPNGRVSNIWHRIAPLWRGLHRMTDAVAAVRREVGSGEARHVVTMTGELTDVFPTRAEGVRKIDLCLERMLPDEKILYFSAESGFTSDARHQAYEIGSLNWYASTQLIALHIENGVFVDMGSTTTDIIRIRNHQAVTISRTDAQRLRSRELLYTGIVRTPLMSLATRIQTEEGLTNLVAENFAATADVYNLLELLPESMQPFDTCDGAGCSAFESARRLARMVGEDCEEKDDLTVWKRLAQSFAQLQQEHIVENINALMQGNALKTLVGAGSGRFVLPQVAAQCNLSYQDVNELLEQQSEVSQPFTLADCLPAYAVAELYRRNHADS